MNTKQINSTLYGLLDASSEDLMASWWDSICNCNEDNKASVYSSDVISSRQWSPLSRLQDREYEDRKLRDTSAFKQRLTNFSEFSPEESFMLLCFIHEACSDLGMPEAVGLKWLESGDLEFLAAKQGKLSGT